MILQTLYELHDRLEADPNYDVASEGFSLQKITFVIVLEPDGSLVEIQDWRQKDGNQMRPRICQVLGAAKPPGAGINPCLLWDNTGYLLGYKKEDPKPERAIKTFHASRAHHIGIEAEIDDPSFSTACRFLESWRPEQAPEFPILDEVATGFGLFKIRGQNHFIHEAPAIHAWWLKQLEQKEGDGLTSNCLITGKNSAIADLHAPKIKGVKDAQGAGALIVSFNKKAFESYGRESGLNAPVSEVAASKYCKALNALLTSDRHRIQIGDATTVFWTESPTKFERCVTAVMAGFDEPDADEEPTDSQATTLMGSLQDSLRAMGKGGDPTRDFSDELGTPFYILGLTGQAGGRIGIRFWHHTTVGDLMRNLAAHHADLGIVREWDDSAKRPDPEFPAVWMLLRQTGRESKDVPPNLGGALMHSILQRTPYPQVLATGVLNRIRADRQINYLRAAILKGWLTRLPNSNIQIPMTYQAENAEPAYRLGALFALLEKTQADALGDVNAGIRDRFYSSASATPANVFPRLMRTYGHHLSKASSGNKGYEISREREVQTILGEPTPLLDFPAHLNLRQQGLFAIGYYHKRKDIYTKKKEPTVSKDA